ncbi:MAG: A24 family peptidase [Terriglobales bacterium]|jgi:prepilin peptidase CpaA
MGLSKQVVWLLPALFAAIAGFTDWRSRRIPNWLTVGGLGLGFLVNSVTRGWLGAKDSLLGAGLGLLLLLPFVLVRSLGAGDWKLIGALGAFLGPSRLITVLFATVLVAGVMALVLVIWNGRMRQTLRNIAHMMAAVFSFHLPGPEVSLDNPEALKVPFGVAAAIAVVLHTAGRFWGIA